MTKIKAKDFAVLIVIGTWLLVTLSACENSRHTEIMSTEDLHARAQTSADTDGDQSGVPLDQQAISREPTKLAEISSLVPEPPPSPTSPLSDEQPVAESEVVQAEVPAPTSEVAETTLSTEEPGAEPEMPVAQLEPSDFVPEASAPELGKKRDEAVVDSGLADVFFDFDKYAIHSGAVSVLEKNAELLKQTHKNSSVLIEGHCDERGTGEYNLELGKRRAQAVKDYLVDLGIEESRIQIVSYGKESPFCTESTLSCWQQNRRGHFVQQFLLSSSQQ